MKILVLNLFFLCKLASAQVLFPEVNLQENLSKSAIHYFNNGQIQLSGNVKDPNVKSVLLSVTTSFGEVHHSNVKVIDKKFTCSFPADFTGNPKPVSQSLYITAKRENQYGTSPFSSEITLIALSSDKSLPDLPLIFMDDFIGVDQKKDRDSDQWSRNRSLVNLFMNSHAAKIMKIYKPGFDLDKEVDFAWFKDSASLYEFNYRDREWSTPLKNRVARGFWQAVWNNWFNRSNNHYWDNNQANTKRDNFRPYTFANDLADLIILYQMLTPAKPVVQDNRILLKKEALENLISTQHKTKDNFALKDQSGNQENYTAGAFHYGMFESGEWLEEGKGWFVNPNHSDYRFGGVFNGRSMWALGVSLRTNPKGPLSKSIIKTISLCLSFCFNEIKNKRYVKKTAKGKRIWSAVGGEHSYLLLGMINAAQVYPNLKIPLYSSNESITLRELCIEAVGALCETALPNGNWTGYANADAVSILALATACQVFRDHPLREKWKITAERAAQCWFSFTYEEKGKSMKGPHFTNVRNGSMTFYLSPNDKMPHISLYQGGHWIQALSELYSITENPLYLNRAQEILVYYCGNNPLHVRLLSEIGSVPNRVTDTNLDGIEDTLYWDAYPESTAFVQMGLLRLIEVLPEKRKN